MWVRPGAEVDAENRSEISLSSIAVYRASPFRDRVKPLPHRVSSLPVIFLKSFIYHRLSHECPNNPHPPPQLYPSQMDSPSSSSSSSSTRSSPVHHASLVDPATHSPALLDLIDVKISRPLIGMFHLITTTCGFGTYPISQNMSSNVYPKQSTTQWADPRLHLGVALLALQTKHSPHLSQTSSLVLRLPLQYSSLLSSTSTEQSHIFTSP